MDGTHQANAKTCHPLQPAKIVYLHKNSKKSGRKMMPLVHNTMKARRMFFNNAPTRQDGYTTHGSGQTAFLVVGAT